MVDRLLATQHQADFRLAFENQTSIAPGIAITVDLEFCSRNAIFPVWTDRALVISDGFRQEIPLVASKPCAILDFSRFVNYGNILTSHKYKEVLTIWNTGSVPGKFREAVSGSELNAQKWEK